MFDSVRDIFDNFSLTGLGKRKVGLALGSGSARGWAHIGVLRALDEAGVQVDYVAGTSMGALVGAVYCTGNMDALEEIALQFDWRQVLSFMDIVLPKSGLIDGKKVSEFVGGYVNQMKIEELPIAFNAVSTDLNTGREVIIDSGDVIEAVRASISVPGMFTPAKVNGKMLVDGGLVNPVPVSVARAMGADIVIAVDLNHGLLNTGSRQPESASMEAAEKETPTQDSLISALKRKVGLGESARIKEEPSENPDQMSIYEVISRSIDIAEVKITEANLATDPPDLLIRPRLGNVGFFEFSRASESIREGYKETRLCLKNARM